MNYYNEIEPYCAKWLQNLMDAGEIPKGVIDTRSIEDVRPDELTEFTQCHFFAGIGGWPLALRLAGWPDSRPAWTGSCPCQPFSAAGKGAGFDDERHLWAAWQHLIAQCLPPVIFGEQVTAATEWLGLVLSDLEGMGYAVDAKPIEAACVGAIHRRDRVWIVADAEWHKQSRQEPCNGKAGRVGRIEQPVAWHRDWQGALRSLRVVDDGIQRCVEATDACRNAIVPQVASEFISAYCEASGLIADDLEQAA